jgi:hypothetical protein
VSKIFFYEPRRREGREGREEKRNSSQLRGGLIWQYYFIYEEDFFNRRGRRGHREIEFLYQLIRVHLRLSAVENSD